MDLTSRYASLTVRVDPGTGALRIQGRMSIDPTAFSQRTMYAAAPIDRMQNYAGSGLPWTCEGQAFDGSPNLYQIPATGVIQTVFAYPNSYYAPGMWERIPPRIYLRLVPAQGGEPIVVFFDLPEPDILKLRTLVDRDAKWEKGPAFYAAKDWLLGVPDSAEAAMVAYGAAKTRFDIA